MHTSPHETHSSLTLALVARQELRLHTIVTSSMSKMRRASGGIPASGTPFLPYAQAGSIVTVALSPVAMSRTASSQPRITWCVCARTSVKNIRCWSLCPWAFFEGNGPARQGLCGLDFWPCLSSELSSPSVPLAVALARHTRHGGAAGLRPPQLFSIMNPRINSHAIRSAVRLPRASQPYSYP